MHHLKPRGRGAPGPDFGSARLTPAELESAIRRLEDLERDTARMLRHLGEEQRRLDDRLIAIEHGIFFRIVRALGGPLLRGIGAARGVADPDSAYRLWLSSRPGETPCSERPGYLPVIGVLMSLEGASAHEVERTIHSLRAQTYCPWRLRMAGTAQVPTAVVAGDSRIAHEKTTFSELIGAAREFEDIDYLMFLRPGDALAPSALMEIVQAVQDRCDVVYTDEDCLGPDEQRCCPVFKPDWSPDLLARCMYLGGALAISRAALARIGCLKTEFGPQFEYDAALRLAETGARFRHVPRVLFHSGSEPSPRDHDAARRALAAAVKRREWQADVADGPFPLSYRLLRRTAGAPLVSIVVCSRTPKLVRRLLRNLELRTAYGNYEIVLIEHGAQFSRVAGSKKPVTRVPYEGVFNFSRMSNRGVQASRGEILVFLNDDIEPKDPGWLESLVAEAQRPENGAVGARLLYPSGKIQHGGVVIGILDGAGHAGRRQSEPPFWKWVHVTHNVSAVTGACMAVRREVFEELGGFDEAFPSNYNDVDFCLRLRAAGYEVVYEAEATLIHYEAQSREAVVRYAERERFLARWQNVLRAGDPFYSPNLTRDRDDASLCADVDE